MTRLRDARGARSSGGTVNACGIEQHQDRISRASWEANAGDAGKVIFLGAWSIPDRPWDGREDRADKLASQLADPVFLLHPILDRHLERCCEAGRGGHIEGAGAYVA